MEFRVNFAMAMYENDFFCYVRHPMHLLVLFAIPKSIFIRQDRLNLLNNVESLHVFLGLSPVWNCYPKGSHKKGTT